MIADVGAGSGSLLEPLVAAVGSPLEVWAIEASPAARDVLERHDGWLVAAGMSSLPRDLTGVLIANELLDNLPIALAVRTGGAWEERWVGADGDGLQLVAAQARPEVVAWSDEFGGRVEDGGVVEVQLAAGRWLTEALDRIRCGAVLVIDYGGTVEQLEPRRATGTLRTYKAHHLGPDPLLSPGATDITADVNFTALEAIARRSGAAVQVGRQDDFLDSLGLRDEIGRMRHEEMEAARGADTVGRLRIRTERIAAETLLHPRGLGDFRVLLARVG